MSIKKILDGSIYLTVTSPPYFMLYLD